MFSRFYTIPAYDKQTDRQTSCASIVRAYTEHRAVKICPTYISVNSLIDAFSSAATASRMAFQIIMITKAPLATARARAPLYCVRLSVRMSVCHQNAYKNAICSKSKQFRAMVSIVLHVLFKEPIILPLKFKMADSRHFENSFLAITQQPIVRFQWNFAQRSRIAGW